MSIADKSRFSSVWHVKPRLDWAVGYQKTIHARSDGSTQRIQLSHCLINGERRESMVNFGWYTTNGAVTDANISFDITELSFLKESIAMALGERKKIRVKKLLGERMLTVESNTVVDPDFVRSTPGDVINRHRPTLQCYKSIVTIGYHHRNESKKFTVDFAVASRVIEELDMILFMTQLMQASSTILFDRLTAPRQ